MVAMNNFFGRLQMRISAWMQGRNGTDQLSLFLIVVALILMLFSNVFDSSWVSVISTMMVILVLFRTFSKNLAQRRKECDAFLRVVERPKKWFLGIRNRWNNRKTKRYFKCKVCKTTFSVPRGKGTIRTTCPHCKTQSIRKS